MVYSALMIRKQESRIWPAGRRHPRRAAPGTRAHLGNERQPGLPGSRWWEIIRAGNHCLEVLWNADHNLAANQAKSGAYIRAEEEPRCRFGWLVGLIAGDKRATVTQQVGWLLGVVMTTIVGFGDRWFKSLTSEKFRIAFVMSDSTFKLTDQTLHFNSLF